MDDLPSDSVLLAEARLWYARHVAELRKYLLTLGDEPDVIRPTTQDE